MNRRHFLRSSTAAAGATAASTARPAAASPTPDAAGIAAAASAADAAFPWLEAGVDDLARAMAEGRTSSVELARAYGARIEAIDRAGPRLASVLEVDPDAEGAARRLDAERAAGRLRGPLHGIPIVVKDNIATAGPMQTSAGSPALVGIVPPRDAAIVARLREAGALVLAKANLSEWANFRGRHSISGWSTRGGQTRNPYALDRTPSGSSSGSAAAVAANLCAVGVGTETDGSITSPASACGLVGIKPTLGLVSRDGIVPIAFSQDTAGPMARSVGDAARLLAAMAGIDRRDPATRAQAGRFDAARLLELPRDALRGARLCVATNLVDGHTRATVRLFDAALAALQVCGATLVAAPLPGLEKIGEKELEVLQYEMRHGMAAYLAEFAPSGPHRSLADLIAYNRAHPETLALFGQEWFEGSEAKGPLDDAYRAALAHGRRHARRLGIDALLRRHRADAIVAPTMGPPWLIDVANGDIGGDTPSATTAPAVAGYPHVTVPMGQVHGLPVGLSLIGTAWQDAQLLGYALHFEQATRHRVPPTYRSSVAATAAGVAVA